MKRVETGRFRADMRVVVDNDGPVTLNRGVALGPLEIRIARTNT